MKLTKEDLNKVRHMEGFPIGEDEDIIELSNPPYYTACPNPFIEDFINEYGKPYNEETDEYKREPFASDVSEGKYDPIYKLHSYHTKVPHKAIMRYILHYTEPGDIVFDGFCGTGMTGVAAQMCGNPDSDLEFKFKIGEEMPNLKWGARKAVLNDLSPAATFIAYNYNTSIDNKEFIKQSQTILAECEKECKWMYETSHNRDENQSQLSIHGNKKGSINYVAWSDVLICPNCGAEIIFWDSAVDKVKGKIYDMFNCKSCSIQLKKRDCKKAKDLIYDKHINKNIMMAKQVPVFINYTYEGRRFEKKPDNKDYLLLDKINKIEIPYWYPTDVLPDGDNTMQPINSHGLSNVHHFYTKRNLYVLSKFYNMANGNPTFLFALSKVANQITKQYRLTYMNGCWGAGGGPMSGTLYIPSLTKELNILNFIEKALDQQSIRKYCTESGFILSTQSATNLKIKDDSIDYIFTDPPFGANLNYSELSFIWESWFGVKTNNKSEAIINRTQEKGLLEYQDLMLQCFKENYRILKPNRWMTVEFHNSKNSVWNAIQESLLRAGFIIADVRTLDKQHNSLKQVTTSSSVKQDLIISAYKPKDSLKQKMIANAGTEESAWDFVREHLNKLPIVVEKSNKIEIITERQAFLLFDRMVAYHIMSGISVPLDAGDFYKGLDEKFLQRDKMYFLHDQINEYDNARIVLELEPIQFSMFVNDEKNAIAWLYYQLEEPQTYSDIQPKFMKEAKAAKHEKLPELGELLEENFLQNENGQWYIPDPTKSGDIIKLREKRLLKEFDEYLTGKDKLRLFRTEAVRVGFAKLYANKDFKNIIKIANRLPEIVIQEDDKLLMYYDIALSRVE